MIPHPTVPFPMPEMAFNPRTRISPFYDATRRYGCNTFSVYNHMLMPIHYGDPLAEYWNLVTNVTLWDVAVERQVAIEGPDAGRLAQYLTPRNLSKCRVGQCKYVPIVDENGGLLNDPVLLKLADDHYWFSLADNDILLWAKAHAAQLGLQVKVYEPDVSPLQLQGPKATAVAVDLFGEWVHEMRYYRFIETELVGIPVILSRTGWSNERGYEIFLRDSSRGDELWEYIMYVGKPYQISPATPNSIKRIEAGLLSYGTDVTLEDNPFEAGLGKFVDLDQESDFVGKEALKAIKAAGVTRHFVGLEFLCDTLPQNDRWWSVSHDGELAGRMTSHVYSPRLEKNIALAMLSNTVVPGDRVTVHTPWGGRMATVRTLPFESSKVNS